MTARSLTDVQGSPDARAWASVPVTDPALRLMVLSHLARTNSPNGPNSSGAHPLPETVKSENAERTGQGDTLGRIGRFSVAELTQLASLVRAPTIEIGVRADHLARETFAPGVSLSTLSFDYFIRTEPRVLHTRRLIPVVDPALRVMVLSHLIHSRRGVHPQHRQDPLAANKDQFDSLGDNKKRCVGSLASTRQTRLKACSPTIEIRVDLSKLECELNRFDYFLSDQQLFDYFITAGASIRMMGELFKTTARVFRQAQARLGIKTTIGRCCLPSEDMGLEIVAEWESICKVSQFPRDQFYRLHQRFCHCTMAQLYAVVGQSNNTRRSPR